MSRGGRGGGRGGRGGGGMGAKNLPPMGSLTFQDLGGLDKKQSALYPVSCGRCVAALRTRTQARLPLLSL